MKERNLSVEFLKFIAVIVVIHSHMELLYGKYSVLCTGGAIGDAIFFFVSGYTIFLGQKRRFDNWYKRRISRIYPSLIASAILLPLFGYEKLTIYQLAYGGVIGSFHV